MLKSFIDAGVEFLLVGGYAVGIHGYPRTTRDIDLWVDTDALNAQAVIAALKAAGFQLQLDAMQRLQTERVVFRLGNEPFQIDVMTACEGCEWEAAWRRRLMIDIDGLQVPVISLQDLRAAKAAAGRPRDVDDLQNLPPG